MESFCLEPTSFQVLRAEAPDDVSVCKEPLRGALQTSDCPWIQSQSSPEVLSTELLDQMLRKT